MDCASDKRSVADVERKHLSGGFSGMFLSKM